MVNCNLRSVSIIMVNLPREQDEARICCVQPRIRRIVPSNPDNLVCSSCLIKQYFSSDGILKLPTRRGQDSTWASNPAEAVPLYLLVSPMGKSSPSPSFSSDGESKPAFISEVVASRAERRLSMLTMIHEQIHPAPGTGTALQNCVCQLLQGPLANENGIDG